MPRFRPFSAIVGLCLIAGCAAPPRPAPTPPPPPPAAPAPPPPTDWRDLPETKGVWRYRIETGATLARFETLAGAALFTLRCDRNARRITLLTNGAASAPLKVTTSYGSRTLAAPDLTAADPLLDQIAFSRGRFTIEALGIPELVLPAWAEPGRVIEDCRS